MNWGYKILAVYGIFVAGILFMVFKSSQQNFDLVTEDYYAKELKYQQQIDATGRTSALSEPVKTEVKDNQLVVHFPKDLAGKKIEGQLQLYYAADKAKDVVKDFNAVDNMAVMTLPASNKGQHALHIKWTVDGQSYYYEEKIFL
ncbi:MAG: FixH family protein [Ferruginibacter sp.]